MSNMILPGSRALWYTECLPLVNFPVGVVHLIIGIAELVLGNEASQRFFENIGFAKSRDFEEMTWKKLETWSHLQCGLAICSVIGNLFLFRHWQQQAASLGSVLSVVESVQSCENEFADGFIPYDQRVPSILKENREWALEACSYYSFPIRALGKNLRSNEDFIYSVKEYLSILDLVSLGGDLKKREDLALLQTPQSLVWAFHFGYLDGSLLDNNNIWNCIVEYAQGLGVDLSNQDKMTAINAIQAKQAESL